MTSNATSGTVSNGPDSHYIKDSLGYDRDSSQCLNHKAFPWAMMALAVALMVAVTDVGDVSRILELPFVVALAASATVMAVFAFIAWVVIKAVAKKKSSGYINSPFRHDMDMANVVEPVVYEISLKDNMERFYKVLPFLTLIFLFLNFAYIFVASVITPDKTVETVASDSAVYTLSVIVWTLVASVAVQVYRHYLKTYIVRGRDQKVEV